MSGLLSVAKRFKPAGRVVDVREFGNGNINNTFLVTVETEGKKHFVLQRINTHVFCRPELIMHNLRVSTGHILRRLALTPPPAGRRWEVPVAQTAMDGGDYWLDSDGSFWRALSFIEGAQTFDTIKDCSQAEEVGYALGMFHNLLSDLSTERLEDTLEGFHITPRYLGRYDEVMARPRRRGASGFPEADYCFEFIRRRRDFADILENARAEGILRLRPIHGDPKVNNIMMDTATGRAVGVVDLDTLMPGLVHYDIGDCLRSGCNILGEETEKWEAVRFDPDICRAVLRGYLSIARGFLTGEDLGYIYEAVRLMAFELGLRFLTDYLEGDLYFKIGRPRQNLVRALVQFKLTESIESQESAIRSIIRDIE